MKPMPIKIPVTVLVLALGWNTAVAGLEIERDLARVRSEIDDDAVFNRGSCAAYLDRGTRFLYQHGVQTYGPADEAGCERLRQRAPILLRGLFELRLALQARLRSFHHQGSVDVGCIDSVRRTLRYGRFVEETIAEHLVQGREAGLPSVPLEGGEPSLMVNIAFGSAELRPGDLLLQRGPGFVSAAIARIGDEDGQLSHLAMVHIGDDGRTWVMESLFNAGGVVVRPLEEWRRDGQTRVLVLRHEDADLAARASGELYRWIRGVHAAGGAIIPYDYRMNDADRSELYCAELVAYAFERISGGRHRLPVWRTSLRSLHGHPFLERLEIRSTEVFAPADAEVDPRLRLVAEWRDLRRTADSRIKDAILSSILDWMARYRYRLSYRGLRQAGVDFYWNRLRPEGVLADRVPGNMSREFLKAMVGLHTVAALVHSRLSPTLDAGPLDLDYKAVLTAVEDFRRRDCRRLIEHRHWREVNPAAIGDVDEPPAPELHRLIGPPEGVECPLPPLGRS